MNFNTILEQINWANNSSTIIYVGLGLLLVALLLVAIKIKTPFQFIKSVFEEIKKVEWLSKKDLAFYSTMVIVFMIIATIFIALVDIGLIEGRTFLLTSNIF